jgi:mRNA interferase MazF
MVRRPALVLSPGFYNSASGLVVMCPITSRVKGYPFEVRIPEELPVHGVILADQIKSLDWQERKADFVCTVPGAILRQVRATLDRLLEGPASP